jgi:hypothetical protein
VLSSPAILPRGFVLLGSEGVVIGRDPRSPVRLASTTVSRRHAQIVRSGVSYTIVDLKSENGTFVNGHAATKPIVLDHDDLISVGSVQIQFFVVDGHREEVVNRFRPDADAEDTAHVAKSANANALFSGAFTRETLHQLCQLIEFHRHTGVLRVAAAGFVGVLRFKAGTIVEAQCGPSSGEKAARAALALTAGEYAFHAWKPPHAGAVAPEGSMRVQALAIVMDILHREAQAKSASEGFLDERPASDERAILPEEDPAHTRTQRMVRPKLPNPPTG